MTAKPDQLFAANLNCNRRDTAVPTTWSWACVDADGNSGPLPIPDGYERIVTGRVEAGDHLLLPYSRKWKTPGVEGGDLGFNPRAIGQWVSDYHCVIRPIPVAWVGR